MSKIKILPQNIANKIAAGEVVERPASVVKELMENSLDAGANEITVEVKAGGKDLIRIVDDGSGMSQDDALLSLERHATSKIQSFDDLETITTMGFRGEALPSIASVSRLELITRPADAMEGTKISVEGGVTRDVERIGCPVGTRISVANLFFNVPARRKFLKTITTELNHIVNQVTWAALSRPDVGFRLSHNGKGILDVRPCNNVIERIRLIYGKDFSDNILQFDWDFENLELLAFIGKPDFTRSSRDHQLFFLNRRPIKSRLIGGALSSAFQNVIPKGRYPVAILFIKMDSHLVDVNVHPAKTEVRFRNERGVYRDISNGLLMAMREHEYIPEINAPVADIPDSKQKPTIPPKIHKSNPRRSEIENSVTDYLSKQDKKPKDISYPSTSTPFARLGKPIQNLTNRFDVHKRPVESIALPLMNLENLEVKTRLFNTYIVLETPDEVLFIDQHIAEERVVYERLKRQMLRDGVPSQGLLITVDVELSASQASMIDSILGILREIGFDIEISDDRMVKVKSVPSLMKKGDIKNMILELLDQLPDSLDDYDKLKLQDNILITTACHSSIHAGDKMSDAETINLLKELFETKPPYVCPHGRPIVARMKKAELEGKFQRR
ncbi:DNA mismatch repair endonuclease MutL [Candidatus Poribacteria bacterium]|nr:DNA mismatch repair endonuclease MutL [Candidatus Poribacteria bacterium]